MHGKLSKKLEPILKKLKSMLRFQIFWIHYKCIYFYTYI